MTTAAETVIGKRIGTSDGLYGVIVSETKCFLDADVVFPKEGHNAEQVVRMRISKKTGNHYNGTNRYFYWVS
jgi:hypothetical protein